MRTCTRCGENLSVDMFYKAKRGKLAAECKTCHSKRMAANYRKDPAKATRRNEQWRKANPGLRSEESRRYRKRHRKRLQEQQQELRNKEKQAVFAHYGATCACCGEAEQIFLSVEHLNGGGREHRRAINMPINRWLVKNSFPSGFEILCHNCNHGKYLNGGICPHEENNPISCVQP